MLQSAIVVGTFVRQWFSDSANRLSSRLASTQLLSTGLSLKSAMGAVGLTLLFYTVMNWWLCRQIDAVYEQCAIAELQSIDRSAETAERLIRQEWADRRLRGWLEARLVDCSSTTVAHEQLLRLFESGTALPPDVREQREVKLRQMATGRLNGIGALPLTIQSATGSELVREIVGDHLDARKPGAHSREQKAFLVRISDEFLGGLDPPLRRLRRVNGWIQWLTILVAMLLLLLLARRSLLLRSIDRELSGEPTDPFIGPRLERHDQNQTTSVRLLPPEILALVQQALPVSKANADRVEREQPLWSELSRLEAEVDSSVYAPLSFLVGLLPSLGFIGTVLGMGEALLRADTLFSATDRQQAISNMTQELGYAFDTTLIALCAALATGIALTAVRMREVAFLKRWAQRLFDKPAVRDQVISAEEELCAIAN